jgi:signal transduction histidine kinase/CheY-like chemotaxis protein
MLAMTQELQNYCEQYLHLCLSIREQQVHHADSAAPPFSTVPFIGQDTPGSTGRTRDYGQGTERAQNQHEEQGDLKEPPDAASVHIGHIKCLSDKADKPLIKPTDKEDEPLTSKTFLEESEFEEASPEEAETEPPLTTAETIPRLNKPGSALGSNTHRTNSSRCSAPNLLQQQQLHLLHHQQQQQRALLERHKHSIQDMNNIILEVRNAINLGTKILNDLLAYDKIDSKNMHLEKTRIDIEELVTSTLSMFCAQATVRNIRFDVDVESNLPKLKGDPYKIKQILGNLASNALKFTPPGGSVIISIRRSDQNSNYLVVECQDSGIGIAKEKQRNFFQKNVHFDAQTSSQEQQGADTGGSVGLGLFITQGLVELHGGTLQVHSEGLNRGTKFTIKLPFDSSISSYYFSDDSFFAVLLDNFIGLRNLRCLHKKLRIYVIDPVRIGYHRILLYLGLRKATARNPRIRVINSEANVYSTFGNNEAAEDDNINEEDYENYRRNLFASLGEDSPPYECSGIEVSPGRGLRSSQNTQGDDDGKADDDIETGIPHTYSHPSTQLPARSNRQKLHSSKCQFGTLDNVPRPPESRGQASGSDTTPPGRNLPMFARSSEVLPGDSVSGVRPSSLEVGMNTQRTMQTMLIGLSARVEDDTLDIDANSDSVHTNEYSTPVKALPDFRNWQQPGGPSANVFAPTTSVVSDNLAATSSRNSVRSTMSNSLHVLPVRTRGLPSSVSSRSVASGISGISGGSGNSNASRRVLSNQLLLNGARPAGGTASGSHGTPTATPATFPFSLSYSSHGPASPVGGIGYAASSSQDECAPPDYDGSRNRSRSRSLSILSTDLNMGMAPSGGENIYRQSLPYLPPHSPPLNTVPGNVPRTPPLPLAGMINSYPSLHGPSPRRTYTSAVSPTFPDPHHIKAHSPPLPPSKLTESIETKTPVVKSCSSTLQTSNTTETGRLEDGGPKAGVTIPHMSSLSASSTETGVSKVAAEKPHSPSLPTNRATETVKAKAGTSKTHSPSPTTARISEQEESKTSNVAAAGGGEREGNVGLQAAPAPPSYTMQMVKPVSVNVATWLAGFHVLLVDDAQINLKMVSMLMKRLGCRCTTALNGQEAVEHIRANLISVPSGHSNEHLSVSPRSSNLPVPSLVAPTAGHNIPVSKDMYDFVLMDNYMPVMDGPSACTQMRHLGYSRPIIGLTGHALGEDLQAFRNAGANAVLTKPLDVAELKTILALLMNTLTITPVSTGIVGAVPNISALGTARIGGLPNVMSTGAGMTGNIPK